MFVFYVQVECVDFDWYMVFNYVFVVFILV